MSTVDEVLELGKRWAAAERNHDSDVLDSITVDDFTLVGPFGFIQKKEQWLDRYRSGIFAMKSLTWDEIEVRDYGDTAVAVGVYEQKAEYQGNPSEGRFRATHILLRRDGDWLLAGMHLSAIAAPPGAPSSAKD